MPLFTHGALSRANYRHAFMAVVFLIGTSEPPFELFNTMCHLSTERERGRKMFVWTWQANVYARNAFMPFLIPHMPYLSLLLRQVDFISSSLILSLHWWQ